MDMRIFVESLTLAEMNELSNVIHDVRKKWAKECAKELTEYECACVDHGQYIDAIKSYRNRNVCSLLEAKVAVDVYKYGDK